MPGGRGTSRLLATLKVPAQDKLDFHKAERHGFDTSTLVPKIIILLNDNGLSRPAFSSTVQCNLFSCG
jgi:hypothetical protein